MSKKITSLMDKMVKALEFLTGVFALVMMCALLWQVVTRFILKIPSVWTEEIARYSFINMAMLGAAVGVKKGTHFGMTLLTDKLKGGARNIYYKYIVNVAILICSVIIVVYGWEFSFTYGLTRVSPTFLVPMIWSFIIIPIAGVFMVMFSLYNILLEDYSHVVSLEEELRNEELQV